MTPKVELSLRLGGGALLLYLAGSGLLGSELGPGEVFLRAVQLVVAAYLFWTGYRLWRRQQAEGPDGTG